eukprot:scaffold12161_cov297-Chaetoceros_neogracile.AAC.8
MFFSLRLVGRGIQVATPPGAGGAAATPASTMKRSDVLVIRSQINNAHHLDASTNITTVHVVVRRRTSGTVVVVGLRRKTK